jgi:hypothetical protein
MLMMEKPKNLEFEPVHPKNVLLASVVHGISCLLLFYLSIFSLRVPKSKTTRGPERGLKTLLSRLITGWNI